MNSIHCRHCDKTAEQHDHAFEAATVPQGCVCNPTDWAVAMPEVCKNFRLEAASGLCLLCSHEPECHSEAAK